MDAFLMLLRWLHFLFGITWIGLLYYLNFVQTPAAKPRAPSTQLSADNMLGAQKTSDAIVLRWGVFAATASLRSHL
jgi:uncharacterized membrane protein